MILVSYNNFVEAFGSLTPFELDHFSGVLYENFNGWIASNALESRSITSLDLKAVLVRAMKDAHIEIATRNVEDAQRSLDMTRTRIFKDSPLD